MDGLANAPGNADRAQRSSHAQPVDGLIAGNTINPRHESSPHDAMCREASQDDALLVNKGGACAERAKRTTC